MAKPSEHQEVKTPKVFISYAQSDERVGESKFIPIFCELLKMAVLVCPRIAIRYRLFERS